MKKSSKSKEARPSHHPPKSSTHGFTVIPNPYENKWDHVPVKETTQRLVNIGKTHRKRKQKLCFSTSTRSIPMRAQHAPVLSRPSSAPVSGQNDHHNQKFSQPVPPSDGKTKYSTRVIRSSPRTKTPDKSGDKEESLNPPPPPPPPTDPLVQIIEDTESREKLKVAEAEKLVLKGEIDKLKQQISDLEGKLDYEEYAHKEQQQRMQLEFNKNLTQTLNEKKKEFRMMKENHYDEIGVLKIKMNDALKMQRSESSYVIAKLKGEIDSNRESYQNNIEKIKLMHSEEVQDLQSDLTIKHETDKSRELLCLEERLTREKGLALEALRMKQDADIKLMREQHDHQIEDILHKFEGISMEEVETNRSTIQAQEIQLMCHRRNQKQLEDDLRNAMNDLAQHKTALKQLQESFFEKVQEVDKKYTSQLSSLLVDNKDLRKRYLKKCDEHFTLKAAYNRLSEAKGYIAKEMLTALMQGKQPHVITSSAVKASWSSDGLNNSRRGSCREESFARPFSRGDTLSRGDSLSRGDTLSRGDSLSKGDILSRGDTLSRVESLSRSESSAYSRGDTFPGRVGSPSRVGSPIRVGDGMLERPVSACYPERATSACSVEDPAALLLSTCSYIHDNSSCTRNPRPLSENMFSNDHFLHPLTHTSSEGNLSSVLEGKQSRVEQPLKQRPLSSVCVVRPHSRQAFSEVSLPPPPETRSRSSPQDKVGEVFSLPALCKSKKNQDNEEQLDFEIE